MTNAECKELIAKEFGVSKNEAKKMVTAMLRTYRYVKAAKNAIEQDRKE